MQFHIEPLWTDEDTLMEVRVSLAGNGRQSWCQAHCYPETFSQFGQALMDFPNSTSHEVRLELGSTDPSYGEHLLVRAFVYDGAGHCAVQFKAESRGDILAASSVNFAVPTEAASLNQMGKNIVAWALSPAKPFEFEGAGL